MTAREIYDKYAQESYQNSFDHGFWEDPEHISKGEMVKLMIGETSECQEANRINRRFSPKNAVIDYTKWCFETYRDHIYNPDFEFRFAIRDPAMMSDKDLFSWWFEANVKNCEGDELADTAIRIMGYVHGWRCHFIDREYRKVSTGNFSHDLLRIDWYILLAFEEKGELHPGKDWGYVMAAICKFAEDWNIDLDWHIAQKQRYNRTRPYKHSKAY